MMVNMANIPPCLIGMEACCGSHFVVAALTARGHDVKLMPVQFVKPFLNGLPGEICTIENEELV